MGWVDWLLKPFRGRAAEPDAPESATPATTVSTPTRASAAAPTPAEPKAERKKADKRAEKKAKAATPASEQESGAPKRKKKARKYGLQQATPEPPSQNRPETVPQAAPAPVSEEAAPAAPAPVAAPAPPAAEAAPVPPASEAATAESPPAPPQPEKGAEKSSEEARRAEAAENRRRARLPQFHALLSRTDALLAVAEAEPRHLVSARRQLVEGWARLGSPPREAIEELTAARDARLKELDERIGLAAAAAEAEQQTKAAQRWAIVEEAKALAEREDLKGAGPAMGELRTRLRALGRIGPEDPAAVAFAQAEARLKERQEQIRADRDANRREQLERLEQLVLRAEALARSADPEAAAERVKALQATWKTVRVPGPRGEVDAAWTRFRAACDAVFAARTAARAEASRVALERMEAIVLRLESLVENGVEGDPEDEITKALATWRRAGRAPREVQQPLWERLQRAFDQLRAPPVDLSNQDATALHFRPFEGLGRDDGSG